MKCRGVCDVRQGNWGTNVDDGRAKGDQIKARGNEKFWAFGEQMRSQRVRRFLLPAKSCWGTERGAYTCSDCATFTGGNRTVLYSTISNITFTKFSSENLK